MEFIQIWVDFISTINSTKRAGLAFVTSMLLVISFGGLFIRLVLKSKKLLQPIRDDGPQTHRKKEGTPTLGGILIITMFYVSDFIWLVEINAIIKIIMLTILCFSLIGLIDDLMKLILKSAKGLSIKIRLLAGFSISFYAMYNMINLYPPEILGGIYVPYIDSFYIWVGSFGIILFGSFVIVGTANSVNLTDGLDGLASLVVITILVALLILLSIMLTPGLYSSFMYSSLFYYNQIREVLVVIASLIGALLGFLWYNGNPAKIFMGDVGSLGIGSALGIITVVLKQELFLFLAGFVLVLESLSVIIQVLYYKIYKKRIFLMAPLHHHFEKKGLSETEVVKKFWLFTILMCTLALLMVDIF